MPERMSRMVDNHIYSAHMIGLRWCPASAAADVYEDEEVETSRRRQRQQQQHQLSHFVTVHNEVDG